MLKIDISGLWNAFGRSQQSLLKELSHFDGAPVVIWGCGLNGFLAAALLHDSGIKLSAAYDAARTGKLLGIPIEPEPITPPHGHVVLIAMDGPAEAVEKIEAVCKQQHANYLHIAAVVNDARPGCALAPFHDQFLSCREQLLRSLPGQRGSASIWGCGTNGRMVLLLLLGTRIKIDDVYDASPPEEPCWGVVVENEPDKVQEPALVLICLNGPKPVVDKIVAFVRDWGGCPLHIVNSAVKEETCGIEILRLEHLPEARFLYCEGVTGLKRCSVQIFLDGRSIGNVYPGLTNFRDMRENAWKFELQITDQAPGLHRFEARCEDNGKILASAKRGFIINTAGPGSSELSRTPLVEAPSAKGTGKPDANNNTILHSQAHKSGKDIRIEPGKNIIFFTHPALDNDQQKNLLNKSILMKINNYLDVFGWQLVFVGYSKLGKPPSGFASVNAFDHSSAHIEQWIQSEPACKSLRRTIDMYAHISGAMKAGNLNSQPAHIADESKTRKLLLEMTAGLEGLISLYRPRLILNWAEYNLRTRLTQAISAMHKLPSMIMHEGFLPESMQLDTEGEVSLSYPCRKHESFQALPVNKEDLKNVEHIIEFARGKESRNAQASDSSELLKRIESIRRQGKKIILYLGCNDWLMGLQPPWMRCQEALRTPFVDSYDALSALIRSSTANNWHIVFKPHPHYQSIELAKILARYDSEDRLQQNLTVTYLGNVIDLIKNADVVATLMSSGAYEGMMHGRPVVLMGDHPMRNKKICYDVSRASELVPMIRNALDHAEWLSRQRNFKCFVARMVKYYLFPQSEQTMMLFNKTEEDIVRFLMKKAAFAVGDTSCYTLTDRQA